jgi:hypothetical protein
MTISFPSLGTLISVLDTTRMFSPNTVCHGWVYGSGLQPDYVQDYLAPAPETQDGMRCFSGRFGLISGCCFCV